MGCNGAGEPCFFLLEHRSRPPAEPCRSSAQGALEMKLLMLEDDLDRIARFTTVLHQDSSEHKLTYRRTAPSFIELYLSLTRNEERPDLICLDHDLFTDHVNDPDPGDGRDVAVFLSDCEPICPVLIHSTNASAADSMLYNLLEAGWIADRIVPLGTDWIEAYWFPYVRDNFRDNQNSV